MALDSYRFSYTTSTWSVGCHLAILQSKGASLAGKLPSFPPKMHSGLKTLFRYKQHTAYFNFAELKMQ